jgi:peptidyl-prolyl isomerase E (cyclophilin E)
MEIQRWIDPTYLKNQVFIGNLPIDATPEEIVQALSEVGSVRSITVYRRGRNNTHHAFAFIEMNGPDEALKVIEEFDRGEMRGKELRISPVRA